MKSDIPLDDSVTARTDSDSSETKGLIKETWRTFTVGLSLYQTMNVLHVSSSTHGPLKRVLAWYANLPEIRSHVYFAGILSCETDLPGVSVLFIVRVLTHNLFLSTGDHSSAHLSMLLDRRWALMITTCSTHRVEPGGCSHTSCCFGARLAESSLIKPQDWDANPVEQSRSTDLGTLMGVDGVVSVDKVGNSHCHAGPIIQVQEDFAERKRREFDDLCTTRTFRIIYMPHSVRV
ncbi:hypothetical protein DFH94DRAFT_726149 [Russula ochroleuca]|uniref:Uncharacterized protein n=1 Tax=Russula ochroleuca TaxID=152965 RepID=A0A9P5N1U6_9AGAM|nr:hypothetical protein DFH94DRAFT_726149 [Russula ochroleuca]